MFSRNLSVPDFAKRFFVSRKGRCMKDSERTYNRKGVSMPFHILTPKSCLTYLYLLCLNTLISMLHSPEQMGTDQDRYYNGQIIRCRLRINNAFQSKHMI